MSLRFRFALAVGFCLGYYFGAKAGRERYQEIRARIEAFKRSDVVDKAKAAVDLGVERVRESVREATHDGNGSSTSLGNPAL